MFELPLGVACILIWGVIQFAVQPAAGLYHILLAAGVLLTVRGIAVSRWGTPEAR